MILLLKIAVPPLLVAIASLAARWWGPTVGGMLVGMPWMTGPVLFFLALDKGTDFAVGACTGIRARGLLRRAFHAGVRRGLHLRALAGEPGSRGRCVRRQRVGYPGRRPVATSSCHSGDRDPRGRLPAAAASAHGGRVDGIALVGHSGAHADELSAGRRHHALGRPAGPAPVGDRVDLSRHGDSGLRLHAPPVGARRRAPLAARHHAGAAGICCFFLSVGLSLPTAGLVPSFVIAAALVLAIDGMLLIGMHRRQPR